MNTAPKTVSELFPTKYLSHDDLRGKSYFLTIKSIYFEEMRDRFTNKDVLKAVLYFEEANKGLPLNKTQALAIAAITGSEEFENWKRWKVGIRPIVYKGKKTIEIYGIRREGL